MVEVVIPGRRQTPLEVVAVLEVGAVQNEVETMPCEVGMAALAAQLCSLASRWCQLPHALGAATAVSVILALLSLAVLPTGVEVLSTGQPVNFSKPMLNSHWVMVLEAQKFQALGSGLHHLLKARAASNCCEDLSCQSRCCLSCRLCAQDTAALQKASPARARKLSEP